MIRMCAMINEKHFARNRRTVSFISLMLDWKCLLYGKCMYVQYIYVCVYVCSPVKLKATQLSLKARP